jgi:hypothetical protein
VNPCSIYHLIKGIVLIEKLIVIEQRSLAFEYNVVSVLEVIGGDATHFV